MSNKRSVSTDALETLGNIIEGGGRDAIHLAVEPVMADEAMYAGQHIGIIDGKATTNAFKKLGIVDPFITGPIQAGQMFWLVVYPRQITSLRHVWSHPDFKENGPVATVETEEQDDIAKSTEWIRNWAFTIPLRFDVVMSGADDMVAALKAGSYGEYLCFGGLLEGEYVPDEFWAHYEIVRGTKVDQNHRQSFFTCSC